MKKLLLILALVIIVPLLAFFLLNNFIYTQKQSTQQPNVEPYTATLTGYYECLPHTDSSVPQTDECVYGMRTDDGEYYALDFSSLPEETIKLIDGERVSGTGTVTPIEMLSTDQWKKYPIKGILSVSEPLEILY